MDEPSPTTDHGLSLLVEAQSTNIKLEKGTAGEYPLFSEEIQIKHDPLMVEEIQIDDIQVKAELLLDKEIEIEVENYPEEQALVKEEPQTIKSWSQSPNDENYPEEQYLVKEYSLFSEEIKIKHEPIMDEEIQIEDIQVKAELLLDKEIEIEVENYPEEQALVKEEPQTIKSWSQSPNDENYPEEQYLVKEYSQFSEEIKIKHEPIMDEEIQIEDIQVKAEPLLDKEIEIEVENYPEEQALVKEEPQTIKSWSQSPNDENYPEERDVVKEDPETIKVTKCWSQSPKDKDYPEEQAQVKKEPQATKVKNCCSQSPIPFYSSSNRSCCIAICSQIKDSQMLYPFPNSEPVLLQWLVNTQKQPHYVDPLDLYVCQMHFEPTAFIENLTLHSWAVPTLHLGHDDHVIPNAIPTAETIRYIREHYCSISSCFRTKEDGVRLHEYPEHSSTMRKWAARCNHNPLEASSQAFMVCQLHFIPECFDPDSGDLYAGSVPTLKLFNCLVPGCEDDKSRGRVRYYPRPRKSVVLDAWCTNLRIPKNTLLKGDKRICSRHFEYYCFNDRNHLRPGARPTLHLSHDEEVLANPKNISPSNEENCCVVPGCGRIRQPGDQPFIPFPKFAGMAQRWIFNLRLKATFAQLINRSLCMAHFEESCYLNNKKLRIGAMPTLKLGHSDPDIYVSNTRTLGKKITCQRYVRQQTCYYPECEEVKKTSYELPQKNVLRQAWLRHIGIEEPSGSARLCPLHFIILYEDSVENFSEHAPEQLMDDNYRDARAKGGIKSLCCAVKGCKMLQPRDGGLLFDVRRVKLINQMWWENGQIDSGEINSHKRICSKHFEPQCFTAEGRMYPWSVPTLQLPAEAVHLIPTLDEWKEIHARHIADLNKEDVEWEEEVLESVQSDEEIDSRIDHNESGEFKQQVLEVVLVEPVDSCETEELKSRKMCSANRCVVRGCPVTFRDVNRNLRLHKLPESEEATKMWLHNTQVKLDKQFWRSYRICSRHFLPDCFQGSRVRKGAVPMLRLGPREPDNLYASEWIRNREKRTRTRF